MRTRPSLSYRHPMLPDQQRQQSLVPLNQRLQAGSNVTAAALFVIGCIGFYSPRLHTGATTAFLIGSVLFLVSALSALGTAAHPTQPDHPQPSEPSLPKETSNDHRPQ
jgi:YrhK-like protein